MRYALLTYTHGNSPQFEAETLAPLGVVRAFSRNANKYYIHRNSDLQTNRDRIELHIRRESGCTIEDYWLDDAQGGDLDTVTDLLEKRFFTQMCPENVGGVIVDWGKHSEPEGWVELLSGNGTSDLWKTTLEQSSFEVCRVTERVWETIPELLHPRVTQHDTPIRHFSIR